MEYTPGDHIAAAWLNDDSGSYEWYLGVVEKVTDDSITASYFKKASKDSTRWNFPEEEMVQQTCSDQILCKINEIAYQSGNVIRCTISRSQVEMNNSYLNNFINNLV